MFKGSNVALITPFKNDKLDDETYIKLIHFHIENGTSGLVPAGTTGESPTLSHKEHERVIELCVQESNGKLPVFAGTGSNSTEEAISLTTHAEKIGASGALIVTPYYNKPTQEGLYRHFMTIAEEVDIPQILYNVPSRTACDLINETALRLANHQNIVGLKDATGDLSRLESLIENLGEDLKDKFLLYSGDDPTSTQFMLRGGAGTISVTANIVPQTISNICSLVREGRKNEALDLDQTLSDLNEILFVESNPIPVKWMLHRIGRITDGIRLPLSSFNVEFHDRAETILKNLHLLN